MFLNKSYGKWDQEDKPVYFANSYGRSDDGDNKMFP